MKLKSILLSFVLIAIFSFEVLAQTQLTIISASANVNTGYTKCSYQSIVGCAPGWWGTVPMVSTDWITFDLGSTNKITQITFNQSTTTGAPVYRINIEGSNDNVTFSPITTASVVTGANSIALNSACRYIKLTGFSFNNPPANSPIYFNNVKIFGEAVTTFESVSVTKNLYTNALRVNSAYGYIDMGPLNSTWAHIYTDRPNFIINKNIYTITGGISSYSTGNLFLMTNGTTRMTILNSNGNVGIGCTNPAAKLSVNGKIQATEIEIETTPCSDFVFENDYKLMSLNDLRKFVESNKHLPEIPSAKEFKENGGYNLSKMDDLLLRKVEELTLYIIQLEKKVSDLEKLNTKK